MSKYEDSNDALVLPQVYILPAAKQKMDAYIQLCELEVSGLGTVRQMEGGSFLVEDVFLLDQECSAASTVLDDEALAVFYTNWIRRDLDTSLLRLWWHSHCDFGVFWSGVDTANIDRLMGDADWLVSIVGNKRGQFRTRLDSKVPVRLSVDELSLSVLVPPDLKTRTACSAELKKKVRKLTYTQQSYWGGRYGNWKG